MGSHTQWFADIDHNFIGIAYPVAIDHVVGLSVTMLSSGEMEQTTVQQPDGNGVFFEATDLAVGLTYGMHLTDKLSVGLTGKYIRQTAFNESAQTFAADIGILLDTDFHGLRIGMDFSNLGGELQLDGTDLITNATVRKGTSAVARLATESYQLPLNFRVGVAMKVIGNSPGAVVSSSDNALTVTIDGNHPNDNRETLSCGTEYVWNDLLAVRGGYIMNHDVAKFSFGGGIHWTMMENFGLNLDYAYADLGILNSVQRISLSLQF
jgi:opacity protein-like surface antigen